MLNTPATHWKAFFQSIDKEGLGKGHLVIGLKAKERAIK